MNSYDDFISDGLFEEDFFPVNQNLDAALSYWSGAEYGISRWIYRNETCIPEVVDYSENLWQKDFQKTFDAWTKVPIEQKGTARGVQTMLENWYGHPVQIVGIYEEINLRIEHPTHYYGWRRTECGAQNRP